MVESGINLGSGPIDERTSEAMHKALIEGLAELDNPQCLAGTLDGSFIHGLEHDSGIASAAFDKARHHFGIKDLLECKRCEYMLRLRRDVKRNEPMLFHLYPAQAYELIQERKGKCNRIQALEHHLGELGLLYDKLPDAT